MIYVANRNIKVKLRQHTSDIITIRSKILLFLSFKYLYDENTYQKYLAAEFRRNSFVGDAINPSLLENNTR